MKQATASEWIGYYLSGKKLPHLIYDDYYKFAGEYYKIGTKSKLNHYLLIKRGKESGLKPPNTNFMRKCLSYFCLIIFMSQMAIFGLSMSLE